ncbi:hypothetical protein FRC12_018417 [Ceratobasidium sp. 428]|nr:hypothetical protein FRC12_018417 [Ceratobasidium sp. 428]
MSSNSITTERDVCNDEAAKMSLAGISEQTRLFNGKQLSDPSSGAHARLGSTSEAPGDSDVDHELAGLNALEDGLPGERPAYPFTTLIRYAIKGSPKGRLLLEEIYQAIQSRYPFFTTAPAGWKVKPTRTSSYENFD